MHLLSVKGRRAVTRFLFFVSRDIIWHFYSTPRGVQPYFSTSVMPRNRYANPSVSMDGVLPENFVASSLLCWDFRQNKWLWAHPLGQAAEVRHSCVALLLLSVWSMRKLDGWFFSIVQQLAFMNYWLLHAFTEYLIWLVILLADWSLDWFIGCFLFMSGSVDRFIEWSIHLLNGFLHQLI